MRQHTQEAIRLDDDILVALDDSLASVDAAQSMTIRLQRNAVAPQPAPTERMIMAAPPISVDDRGPFARDLPLSHYDAPAWNPCCDVAAEIKQTSERAREPARSDIGELTFRILRRRAAPAPTGLRGAVVFVIGVAAVVAGMSVAALG